ncbi:helix-turn-helix domain-containing protein [Enterococcus hirae]|uniref:helix-turn-helix domain-containing protein n=1 Tax=Enterococcus TaxID=1350 RepID=UPI0006B1E938|nr:helix-turn-helix transcriptional regulator [Enterococcus hirae]EMF0074972.1 helix-turn-helix transcriptional regulator [Enterococcus hirae]EMF0083514.1 helix-turn-helix transcriptional regulator [Enterococcus hirae]EMF0094124.1 helix-turn-helix transcriptional regulator [Enterococcus hirae]EMF0102092.1 helix-turn-helix transcriptional regulator [Enterococcus hirae]EMF0136245.1 helix-turn-helix transcriptional regulator [Enterococcus hirae]
MRSNDEIVEIIDLKRKEKELSISELARRVGMAKSALSRYFNRTREFPLNRVEEFAKVLGISSEYLLGFEEDLDSNSSIEKIYNQLSPPRQQKVYNFAKQELKEQQEQNKAVIPIEKEEKNSDEIYTLAAHSDDPDKTYTDKEISEIEAFLDQVKADYDKKHNK